MTKKAIERRQLMRMMRGLMRKWRVLDRKVQAMVLASLKAKER